MAYRRFALSNLIDYARLARECVDLCIFQDGAREQSGF
jgi:hypothetical protein